MQLKILQYYSSNKKRKMFFHFHHPFSLILAGPSMSGKSTFLKKLLHFRNSMFNVKFQKIIWCYAENNAKPDISGVIFHKGMLKDYSNEKNERTLIILDDLMSDAYNTTISELFTKGSHHRNTSIILVTQNLFHRSAQSRNISLNAQYIILLKNPRDKQQFSHLAYQIYPENSRELVRVYNQVMLTAHAYFIIDLTQSCNELLRFRTDIFNPNYFAVCFSNLEQYDKEPETFKGEQAYVVCA